MPAAAETATEVVVLDVPAAVVDGPAYVCPNCRYVYAETRGCPTEGWAAGTTWAQLPADWTCPQCAVREKPDFTRIA